MADKNIIMINRAPVMTLWATIVSERLGFDHQEALTLARAVTGLNAFSKGERLGIFEPENEPAENARKREQNQEFHIKVLGRPVPAVNTPDGLRATSKGKPISPGSVERYLHGKYKDDLPEARQAMEKLADAYPPKELAKKAYSLYEDFRPPVPKGVRGWGADGELDLNQIRAMAEKKEEAQSEKQ